MMDRNSGRILLIAIILPFLIVICAGFSYIDPGTGSLIIQVAIASFIAVAAAVTRFRKKISKVFKRDKKEKDLK